MADYYEHHLSIKQNSLLPFKLSEGDKNSLGYSNWHANPEMIFVVGGRGTIRNGKDIVSVASGDIAIFSGGAVHCISADGEIEYYFLIIDEDFCNRNGVDLSLYEFDLKFRSEKIFSLVESLKRGLISYSESHSGIVAAELRRDILSILIEACSSARIADKGRIDEDRSEKRVKEVIAFVKDNLSEAITLDDLSRLCGVTKFHLAREFKRYTGQTVFTYLNFLRCKRAKILISEGKRVAEAAYECGFESLSYFSRTYKRLMGEAPSSSRK